MVSCDYFTHVTLSIPREHPWSKKDKRALSDLLHQGDTHSLADISIALHQPIAVIKEVIAHFSDIDKPTGSLIKQVDGALTQIPVNDMVRVLLSQAGQTHRDSNYQAAMMTVLPRSNLSVYEYAAVTLMDWRAALYRMAHHFDNPRFLLLTDQAQGAWLDVPFTTLYESFLVNNAPDL